MRAMLLRQPAPNEVRVRIRTCGLCHTHLHTIEGDLPLPKLPLVPGHQVVGTIDALGSAVRALRIGDRVGIPWLYSTNGTCPYCLRHTENLCESARFTGYHVNGGYAELCVVREDFAHPLPAAFSDENAARSSAPVSSDTAPTASAAPSPANASASTDSALPRTWSFS